MKENTAKIIISAIAAGLSAYFRVMAIPIVILVLVMIIDYITGMCQGNGERQLLTFAF